MSALASANPCPVTAAVTSLVLDDRSGIDVPSWELLTSIKVVNSVAELKGAVSILPVIAVYSRSNV